MTRWIIALFIFATAYGCSENPPIPRSKGYPRVFLPEKSYQSYDGGGCPYRFEYPVYSEVEADSLFFSEVKDCWIDLYFPDFDAKIHFTYQHIDDSAAILELVTEAHEMSFKHARKADYIDQIPIDRGEGAKGLMYDVGGDAASAVQFYLTDFSDHYMRGALYFNTAPNADSLAPMINFLKEDIEHLMNTFEWQ
jgi:gliding motility-associated lipoprotein GldD